MRILVIAATASLWALTVGQAQGSARNPCYTECQYRCYVQHPGGGPAWTACYLACAEERCEAGRA